MDQVIHPRHLLGHELEYELNIRNVKTKKDRNEKVKVLGRLFAKESQGAKHIDLNSYTSTFENEKENINNTLVNIASLIVDFEGNPADTLFSRVKSRIAHVTGRVQRLVVPAEGDKVEEIRLYKNESYATCLELEADLHEKIIVDQPNDLNQSVSQQPVINISPPVASCSNKQFFLSGLNIKFNGDPKTVYDFIERISDIAQARNIPDNELFKSAIELFTGNARIWFRSIRTTVLNWNDLLQRLKVDFLPPFVDDEIWEQIKARKQRKNESVVILVAEMENLFSRLPRVPCESTKIKYIKQNLLPEYITQLALHFPESVQELTSLVKRLEEASAIKNKSRKSITSQEVNTVQTQHNNNFRANNSNNRGDSNNTKNNIKCWNCTKTGHSYQACKLKRKIFCFRCGNPNVTTKTCARCSKNVPLAREPADA
jgi:hypothetical protein